jgi:hypothetical protein
MRTISTGLAGRQDARLTQPGFLVSIGFASGTAHLSSRQTLTVLGTTWIARSLAISGLDSDSDANASCTIRVGNHDNLMSAFVLADGFAGAPVRVYKFWGTATDPSDLMLAFDGVGNAADPIMPDQVTLKASIDSADNLMTPNTPRIAPPLFNAVLPAGFEIVWGNERYTLKKG